MMMMLNQGTQMGREACWRGCVFSPPSLLMVCTGQREGGRFSCINKQIISHPVTYILGEVKIGFHHETGVRQIWSSGKHPRALIGLKLRHNIKKKSAARRGEAPSPTVFSKAPSPSLARPRRRPTALFSHNGILGLSSNYLRDKGSDDVEWRKITSRSHGVGLLLERGEGPVRFFRRCKTRMEQAREQISARRSVAPR